MPVRLRNTDRVSVAAFVTWLVLMLAVLAFFCVKAAEWPRRELLHTTLGRIMLALLVVIALEIVSGVRKATR